MITKLVNTFVAILILVSLSQPVHGEPMDGKAAQDLPFFRSVVSDIRSGSVLTPAEIQLLQKGLRSHDAVLTSISAWCIGQLGQQGEVLQKDLTQIRPTADSMVEAFVTPAQVSREIRTAPMADKVRRYETLVAGQNPYLKVEAAKALTNFDRAIPFNQFL